MKYIILIIICIILDSLKVNGLFEDWILKPSYITSCVGDFLPNWAVDNCKCEPGDLLSLYTSGKLDSVTKGGSPAKIVSTLFSDENILATVCRHPGCAQELFTDAINFQAAGVLDPYAQGAMQSLGGYVCSVADSYSKYCLAEFAPLARELDGVSIQDFIAGGKLTDSLTSLCASGCIAKLAPYQSQIKTLVSSLGGPELAPLAGILDLPGGFNSVCDSFKNCVVPTKRECVTTPCADDCEWGFCTANKCNSEEKKTLGYTIETSRKTCCITSIFGSCANDGDILTCCKDVPQGAPICPTPQPTQPTMNPTFPTKKPTAPTPSPVEITSILDLQSLVSKGCDVANDPVLLNQILPMFDVNNRNILFHLFQNKTTIGILCNATFSCDIEDVISSIDVNILSSRNLLVPGTDKDSMKQAFQDISSNYCSLFGSCNNLLQKTASSSVTGRILQGTLDLPFKNDKLGAIFGNCDVGGLLSLQNKFTAAGSDIVGIILTDPDVAKVLCKKPKCPEVAIDALDPAKLPPALQDPLVLEALKLVAPKICLKSGDDYCIIGAAQATKEAISSTSNFCQNGCLDLIGGTDFLTSINPLLGTIAPGKEASTLCKVIDSGINNGEPVIDWASTLPIKPYCDCAKELGPKWTPVNTILKASGSANDLESLELLNLPCETKSPTFSSSPTAKPTSSKPTMKPSSAPTPKPTVNFGIFSEKTLQNNGCLLDDEFILTTILPQSSIETVLFDRTFAGRMCNTTFSCTADKIIQSIDISQISIGLSIDEITQFQNAIQEVSNDYCSSFAFCGESLRNSTISKQASRQRQLQDIDLPFKNEKLGDLFTYCDVGGLLGLQSKFEAAGGDIVGTIFTDPDVAKVLCSNPKCPAVAVDALDPKKLPASLQDPQVLDAINRAAPKLCIKQNEEFCIISAGQAAKLEDSYKSTFCSNGCLDLLGGYDYLETIEPLFKIIANQEKDASTLCEKPSTRAPTAISTKPIVPEGSLVPLSDCECLDASKAKWKSLDVIFNFVYHESLQNSTIVEKEFGCNVPSQTKKPTTTSSPTNLATSSPTLQLNPIDSAKFRSQLGLASTCTEEKITSIVSMFRTKVGRRNLASLQACADYVTSITLPVASCDAKSSVPSECCSGDAECSRLIDLAGRMTSTDVSSLVSCYGTGSSTDEKQSPCVSTTPSSSTLNSEFFSKLFNADVMDEICSASCENAFFQSIDLTTAGITTSFQIQALKDIQVNYCEKRICLAQAYSALSTKDSTACESSCATQLEKIWPNISPIFNDATKCETTYTETICTGETLNSSNSASTLSSGEIAAIVIVPIILILAIVGIILLYKKKQVPEKKPVKEAAPQNVPPVTAAQEDTTVAMV